MKLKLEDKIYEVIELCVERLRPEMDKAGEPWEDAKKKDIGQAAKRISTLLLKNGRFVGREMIKLLKKLVVLFGFFGLGILVGGVFFEWRIEIGVGVVVGVIISGLLVFSFFSGGKNGC